ncbi:hypothetical protein BH23CHL6_BH23CHL6_06760 [soil metagenome]
MKPSAAVLFALLSLLVGSCAAPPVGSSPASSTTSSPTPLVVANTPLATPAPTPAPPVATPVVTPPVAPTEPASVPPPASATPSFAAEPPTAQLRLPDGSLVSGKLASWCYGTACADIILGPIEQLPKLQLTKAGDELELSLPTPHRFVYWRAQYGSSAEGDAPLELLAEGGVPYPDPDEAQPEPASPAPELASAVFRAPPSGSWILRVQVSFAGGAGNAPYYWHAVVP